MAKLVPDENGQNCHRLGHRIAIGEREKQCVIIIVVLTDITYYFLIMII